MTHTGSARNEPTSEQIIAALRSAGWLLEQETGAAFGRRGYTTQLGWAFPDPDDQTKSRELDVMAHKRLYDNTDLRMTVSIRCLIECKQSSQPYVLIGGPTDTAQSGRPRLEEIYRFDPVVVGREPLGNGAARLQQMDARDYLGLRELPEAPWNHGFLATQMTRLERKSDWVADNRGIFDSLLYPLAKATQHHRNLRRTSKVNHDRKYDWAVTEFLYPMVVTSAPLYKVDVSQDPYQPQKVGWTSLVRQIRTKTLDGHYIVDAVNAAALGTYLDTHIQLFADQVEHLAREDPEKFVTSGNESEL